MNAPDPDARMPKWQDRRIATVLRVLFALLLCFGINDRSWAADGVGLVDGAGTKIPGEAVEFHGGVVEANDVSGVAAVGDFLLIVSDEAKRPTIVQVLKKDGAAYEVVGSVPLPAGDDEVDLEAVTAEADMVYVTGSHSWSRNTNAGMVEQPKRKASREQFFRFRLLADGTAGPVEGPKSLLPAILASPVLKGFVGIASKENGIDIEGLAVKEGRLHFGFRGPVLRGGWVPVLSVAWDDPGGTGRMKYLQLDGRGIRDIAAVEGGFLVLAGPVGDSDQPFRIYFWDGADQLPGGENGPRPQLLGEFTDLGKAKPEGLAVLQARGKTYDLLVVSDGLPKGGATRWTLTRP